MTTDNLKDRYKTAIEAAMDAVDARDGLAHLKAHDGPIEDAAYPLDPVQVRGLIQHLALVHGLTDQPGKLDPAIVAFAVELMEFAQATAFQRSAAVARRVAQGGEAGWIAYLLTGLAIDPSAPTCHRCGLPMGAGMALAPTVTAGAPDFPGDSDGVTMSEGPGKMVSCHKCPGCGHSLTLGDGGIQDGTNRTTGGWIGQP